MLIIQDKYSKSAYLRGLSLSHSNSDDIVAYYFPHQVKKSVNAFELKIGSLCFYIGSDIVCRNFYGGVVQTSSLCHVSHAKGRLMVFANIRDMLQTTNPSYLTL